MAARSTRRREFGLPFPKGLLLIGIPGTGKSLAAKVTADLWQMPLLRFNVGAVFGSLLGESEANASKALRLAQTVAPCVLQIDEMEKALARGAVDGGTSERVFGSILTWMQEKTEPVFVVATANDISKLPPELLRKGRFDEVFFLDLPNTAERREIFAVHLRKHGRDPRLFNLTSLANASSGRVGAEIEQAVIDALYQAFYHSKRELKTEDILKALQSQVPYLSRSVKSSRNFANGSARDAPGQHPRRRSQKIPAALRKAPLRLISARNILVDQMTRRSGKAFYAPKSTTSRRNRRERLKYE